MTTYVWDGGKIRRVETIEPPPLVTGWRLWYTRPAEKNLTLYSPTHRLPLRHQCTRDRVMHAACPKHVDPPAPGCECGVYAVENVVDGIYRLRAMTRNIRVGARGWFPVKPDDGMVPVLAQVKLDRAVDFDDGTPVLRAASAEITRLFVTGDELIATETAIELADRLAATYGVEAVVGFPDYSTHDWDTRPDWMYTEPLRTTCTVDELMVGFTRGGYQRSKVLKVWLSEEEFDAFERVADCRGLPVSIVAREQLVKLIAEVPSSG